ncbi:GumC family protein [Candidatus Omnitrophota bacterium]
MLQKQPHIQDYIQVLIRRRWVILTFFAVLVVTVLIGSIKQTRIYRATTVLRIEHKSPRVVSVQEVTPMGSSDYYSYKDYYETQYKLIKSRTLLKEVADSLNLGSYYKNKEKDPVRRLARSTSVSPIKNSQLVEISVEDPNPRMAARIANAIADAYIMQSLERNITTANDAAKWLSKKIDEQRQKLMSTESALQQYGKKHNINVLPLLEGDRGIGIGEVQAEYARLQAQLANYSERYTDEHPNVVELKAQIKSLKNKIRGLEDADTGNETAEYRVLEREAQTNKRMYEILLGRLKEVDVSSTLNVSNISIIDRAEIPKKPAKPKLVLNMALAVMVGLVMGGGLGFFVDYLDTTIKLPEDVKNLLGSHCLGGIPEIEGEEESKKDMIVHLEPKSPISESYRSIRTELLFALPDKKSATMLITSAEPKAGKTTTSSNLAIALGQTGSRVLLIDADLRKPQVHRVFNMDRDCGLSDFLTEDIRLDSVIKDTGIENLKVITAGKFLQNPAEAINSKKMDKLINDARQIFDFVLFDSPPIASVTDAVVLADKVDAAVQVVRSGKALAPIVLSAKDKLANTKSKSLGVILNDVQTHHGNYYYAHYKYSRYYGEDGRRRGSKPSGRALKDKVKSFVNDIKRKG